MAIYRCAQCALIEEQPETRVGSKVACARCATPATVFATVFYVEKVLERYFSAMREINVLKQASESAQDLPTLPTAADAAVSTATSSPPNIKATPAAPDNSKPAAKPDSDLTKVMGDIQNSKQLATPEQHAPLKAWFASRNIEANLDYSLVDTTGFFDDAALLIGQGYGLFSELVDRVRFAYRKSHGWVNLELANLSQKDAQAVNQLCRQLYSHTFFARYSYQKQEKIVHLTLQTAPAVRQFFDGGWLEWFAFMTLIAQLEERQRGFSCARSVNVMFPNEDLHELDVFVLPQDQTPICIECKSGEFRRDIDKYLRMRKRLGLERGRFIICAADLSEDQCNGLSAMYELTFVNLESLGKHLQTVL